MKIWLITVNYKDTRPTVELIESLEKLKIVFDLTIFIADNESSEETKNKLKILKNKSSLNIELFFFKKNYYYWNAANLILKKKINHHHGPQWTIICNNDIIFNDKLFFEKLKKYDSKKFHLIGPNILNKSKIQLNPFMVSPMNTRKKFFWDIFFKSYYLSLFFKIILKIKKFFHLPLNQKKIIEVYAIHGSAMIFSNFFFDSGGKLDSNFKLFCEELTTAEISKTIGCTTYFIPDLKLFHNEHKSTKKTKNKILFDIAKESHDYFKKTYLKT